jgi:putative Ca2+/H+ antiporter (TMEM165/GDT1 family)
MSKETKKATLYHFGIVIACTAILVAFMAILVVELGKAKATVTPNDYTDFQGQVFKIMANNFSELKDTPTPQRKSELQTSLNIGSYLLIGSPEVIND